MGLFDAFRRKNSIYDELDESEIAESKAAVTDQPPRSGQVAVRSNAPLNAYGALRMQVLRPSEFRDVTKVADCLKAGQAVVLNLEDMEEVEAKRMIDYVAGVLYAVEGKIEQPSQRTFLLTPRGISVASEDVARLHPEK
ncbi:MAG: cell division protein SepF [Clostridia bacterium]|nr:cell division protein SepF [Clostridia bacterium]